MKTEYLIVGNSAGGIGAVEAIREVDGRGRVVVVSDESYPAYSRPLISKFLAKERSLDSMLFRPADFYLKNDVVTVFGRKASRILLESHGLELEDGEVVYWDKLLLATGGVPIVPRVKGLNKKGIFSFITVEDVMAIDRNLSGVRRAVVVGGGLIGISVSEALVKLGIEVTVVEMKEMILNTILDEQASLMAQEHFCGAGVRFVCGHAVSEVLGGLSTEGVMLTGGKVIPCELLIVAIGVSPRVELARDAGLRVDRGIVVDAHMATSCSDVYACGDAAEACDFIYGVNRVTPGWPNAYLGGRTAGYNMAGVSTEYCGGTVMNSLNYFGLPIANAGIVTPSDDGWEVLSRRTSTTYRKVVLRDGRVVGMIFVGDVDKSGIVFGLMRDRIDVSAFKSALVVDDFGLVDLPRELREKRLKLVPRAGTSSLSRPAECTPSCQ